MSPDPEPTGVKRDGGQRDGGQRGGSPPGTPPPGGPGWRVTPSDDGRGTPPPPRRPMFHRSRLYILVGLIVLLGVNYLISSNLAGAPSSVQVPYSPTFLTQVKAGNVREISSKGTTVQGEFRQTLRFPAGAAPARRFSTEVPTFANSNALSALLQRNNVRIDAKPANQGPGFLASLLLGFGPTLLIVAVFVLIARRAAAAGGAGGLASFGRSKARRIDASQQQITFADVAGIDEAKAELTEIVDFLRRPERYQRLGGRIPRGVLLSGAPGTGKTLLARAVAGEASAPFFQMSASEFVEVIVGVGASRVRDLFAQAKMAAPALIFIDELDAIGRSRSSGLGGFGGGNDEREQTLNQILTEMDGFDTSSGVIVIGATNRPEVLDSALLRPGRFDRRVAVQAPDRVGRREILAVHTRSVPLAADVDLDGVASSTPGMVGADLANLVNEAALVAARHDHDRVTIADLSDALERIVLGAERRLLMSHADRRRTAYHEAGHAIVGMLTPGADPVRKISIIPRGQALGVTFSAPDSDRFNYDERHLLGKIRVALGGRAAEEIVFGDLTTGAESDIQQLTTIARHMVGRWGMSPAIGPVAVLPSEAQSGLLPGVAETSPATQRLVDEEVRRIVDDSHDEVIELLRAHRANLDALTDALLEHETLDELPAYEMAGLPRPPREALESGPAPAALAAPAGAAASLHGDAD